MSLAERRRRARARRPGPARRSAPTRRDAMRGTASGHPSCSSAAIQPGPNALHRLSSDSSSGVPSAPQKVADRSARWSSSWRWSSSESGVVALGDEVLADVAQQQGAAPAVAAEARRPRRPRRGRSSGGTASSRPEVHTSTGRHPRSPKPRIVQSPSGCRCLRTNGSPSMTTRSSVEPGLAVGAAERRSLGGTGDAARRSTRPRRGARAGSPRQPAWAAGPIWASTSGPQRPPQKTVSATIWSPLHLEEVHVVGGVRLAADARRCGGSARTSPPSIGSRSTVSSTLGPGEPAAVLGGDRHRRRGPGTASRGRWRRGTASSA